MTPWSWDPLLKWLCSQADGWSRFGLFFGVLPFKHTCSVQNSDCQIYHSFLFYQYLTIFMKEKMWYSILVQPCHIWLIVWIYSHFVYLWSHTFKQESHDTQLTKRIERYNVWALENHNHWKDDLINVIIHGSKLYLPSKSQDIDFVNKLYVM